MYIVISLILILLSTFIGLKFAEKIESDEDISLIEEWALSPAFADFRVGKFEDYLKIREMVHDHKLGEIEIIHENIQDLIDHEVSASSIGSNFNYSTYNTWEAIDSWIDD